jgi:hypothetical protein
MATDLTSNATVAYGTLDATRTPLTTALPFSLPFLSAQPCSSGESQVTAVLRTRAYGDEATWALLSGAGETILREPSRFPSYGPNNVFQSLR